MTKLEIAKLAMKVSKKLYTHFGMKDTIKLMTHEYIDAINVILEDNEIIPKTE